MNDPQVEAYLVRDVSPHLESGTWRWTYGRPELRFYVPRAGRQQFAMDFTLPDAVWRQTGAVTLTILVNEVVLDKLTLDRPGPRRYRKAVPPGALNGGALNRVVIEQDKVFTAPEDGAKLGFILNSVGFLE